MTRRLAVGYLAAQAVAVPLWWAALEVSPGFRSWFELGDPAVLQSFLWPDIGFALASGAAAVLARRPAGLVLAAVTLGAVGYSTVMTFGHVLASGSGALGAVAMTLATLGTLASLQRLRREDGS